MSEANSLDTSGNSSFSRLLPGLQLAIDSTSLGEFKTCPRKYLYRVVLGWTPRAESVHLTFGILLHQARELYDHLRVDGRSHDEALRQTVHRALRDTWNSDLQRPWISDHKYKNRLTLLRTIVWYLDEKAREDVLQTVVLANGKPAVELSFRFDSGLTSSTGEPVLLCGHLDRIAKLGDEAYIVDIKSTGGTLGPGFFSQFIPDNQFSLYSLAGRVAFETPVAGIIVDGAQVAIGFSRFERGLVGRSAEQLDEWLEDVSVWIGQMDEAARNASWPMNDKACHHYGGCPFRPVCSRPPGARQQWLQADYTKRIWDPLRVRGDI